MTKPTATPKRGPWIAIAAVVALPFVACGGCGVYGVLKIRWAKTTAHAYCDEDVAIGAPIVGLEAKALARGLQVIDVPPDPAATPPKDGRLMAWEGFVFARHFCNVEHDGKSVLAKSTSSLD